MQALFLVLSAILGYLLGTIPVGVLIARRYGTDIRRTGSGNTGTTNVLRTLGWTASLLTLAGDCLKGVAAALIGHWLGGEIAMLLAGFCAVVGHDFPAFSRFKGGKGIATSLGVTFVACPLACPVLIVSVLAIVAVSRMMSIGSLFAALIYTPLVYFLRPGGSGSASYIAFGLAMSALAIFCHRANLRRLFRGEENRLDFGKIAKLTRKYRLFGRKK